MTERATWTQFKRHKGALIGVGVLGFVTLGVLLGDLLWGLDPQKLDIRNKNLRPIYTAIWDSAAAVQWAHPLGTDHLGRDALANMIAGGRTSLAVGWVAMSLSLLIGTVIGASSLESLWTATSCLKSNVISLSCTRHCRLMVPVNCLGERVPVSKMDLSLTRTG